MAPSRTPAFHDFTFHRHPSLGETRETPRAVKRSWRCVKRLGNDSSAGRGGASFAGNWLRRGRKKSRKKNNLLWKNCKIALDATNLTTLLFLFSAPRFARY